MTNTDFVVREKMGSQHPLFKREEVRFGFIEGALIFGFLAAFMGLVVVLSK